MSDDGRVTRILDGVPFPLAYFDETGTCLAVNAAGARLWGAPAAAIVGRRLDELEPWVEGLPDAVNGVLSSGRARFIGPVARPEGNGFHSVSVFPLVEEPDKVEGVVLVDIDATDLVEAQADLRGARDQLLGAAAQVEASNAELVAANESLLDTNEELTEANSQLSLARRRVSEELVQVGELARALAEERDTLEAIMENAPEACLVYLDADFNYRRVNSTYARACQMDREYLIGRNHFELLPNTENEEIFRRARDTGEPVEFKAKPFVFELQPGRGITYWDWTLTPLKSADGPVRGFVYSLVDVTERVRAQQLSDTLNQIDDLVHSTLDTDAIVGRVISDAVDAIGCEAGSILERRQGEWRVLYATPRLPIAPGPVASAPVAEAVVATGAAVTFNYSNAPRDIRETLQSYGIESLLALPLVVQGETVGVLVFDYLSRPTDFDPAQMDFARRLAASISLALANRDLWESEAQAREAAASELATSTVLLRAASALATWTDLEKVLGGLSDIILSTVGRRRAGVYLWDEERREFEAYAHGGRQPMASGTVLGVADVSAVARRVLETKRSAVADYDAMTEAEIGPNLDNSAGLGLLVPLLYRGRLLGIVDIDDEGGRTEYSARDIQLVEAISAQAAVAVENARLYERERRAVRLEDSLNRILTTFISARDPDEILRDIVEASLVAVDADYSLISTVRNGDWVAEHVFGTGGEARLEVRYPYADRPVVVDAAEKRTIQLVEEAMAHPRTNKSIMRTYDVRSFAAVPLILHGEVLGVLELVYTRRTMRFDPATVEFLNRLMVDASVALDQAMEHEYRRRISQTLQEGLLALPERLPGLAFAHTYQSATEASLVGGDFYDLFELDDGQVGITIGDISGKGLDAAVLTALVKNTIRAHAIEQGKTPAQIVGFANRILLRGSPSEVFATVFFAFLDRLSGRLVYCNAAHTAGALVKAGGAVIELPANSPLVGAYDDVVFSDAEEMVEMDDTLFLYTDGLIEARVDGDMYGQERLFDQITDLRDLGLEELPRRLIADVVEFTGGRLTDDVATLTLRRTEWAEPTL